MAAPPTPTPAPSPTGAPSPLLNPRLGITVNSLGSPHRRKGEGETRRPGLSPAEGGRWLPSAPGPRGSARGWRATVHPPASRRLLPPRTVRVAHLSGERREGRVSQLTTPLSSSILRAFWGKVSLRGFLHYPSSLPPGRAKPPRPKAPLGALCSAGPEQTSLGGMEPLRDAQSPGQALSV